MQLEIKYKYNNKEISKKYNITPIEIPEGNDLFKLVYNDYLLQNSLPEKKILDISLKYQIFNKYTSLFAEIELSGKIQEQTKIYTEENIDKVIEPIDLSKFKNIYKSMAKKDMKMDLKSDWMSDFIDSLCKNDKFDQELYEQILWEVGIDPYEEDDNTENKNENNENKEVKENKEEKNNVADDKKNEINLRKEEMAKIMEIINTQNFIEGYWDLNEKTKIIKKDYEKEYNLLIGLKSTKINEKVAITILIIYYISKKYPKLLGDLMMIIKKGKLYIQNETKSNYEEILKILNIT